MAGEQLELFGEELAPVKKFVPAPELVERVRVELVATLQLVKAAERFPWSDLTKMTLAELRFASISNYLPEAERDELRAAFDVEMTRLYAAYDADWELRHSGQSSDGDR